MLKTVRAVRLVWPWFAVVVVALVGAVTPSESLAAPEPRLSGVDYLGDLPTLVADHHDLFAQEGFDVAVEYGSSGKANLVKLREGETDFALMALTPLVIDRLQEDTPGDARDPVILANLAHSTDFNHVVTLRESADDAGAALAGARVGLMRGTNAEFVWSLFAAKHGLTDAGVEVVNMAIDEIADALAAGKIDAGVVWQPWTDRLRARFGDRLTVFRSSTVYTAK